MNDLFDIKLFLSLSLCLSLSLSLSGTIMDVNHEVR